LKGRSNNTAILSRLKGSRQIVRYRIFELASLYVFDRLCDLVGIKRLPRCKLSQAPR
jgi:hypothetical protein